MMASKLELPNLKDGVPGSLSGRADWTGDASEDDLTELSFVKSVIDMAVKITICNLKRHAAVNPAECQADIDVVLTRMIQGIILLEGLAHSERTSKLACWRQGVVPKLYLECCQQLWRLVHLLVAHHLPNKQLNVYAPVHYLLRPVLEDWCLVAGKQQPADVLAFALLKRAAEDERVFAGTVSYDYTDMMPLNSSGAQWGQKQCNVGILWRSVCCLAGQKQFSAAAAALINALWAARDYEEHCKYILHDILDDVFKAVLTGLKEPLPWSTEHCVALTRVLEMCSQLCRAHDATLLTATHASAQKAGVLPVIQQRLQSLQKPTPIQRLQQQFLTATLGLLAPSCDQLLKGPRLDGLPQVLIDLLVPFVPSNDDHQVPAAATVRGYVEIGLAMVCGVRLQCKTLGAVMQLLEQPKDFQHLCQHAIPVCLPPFLQFVEADMERFTERVPDNISEILDLRPYVDMLGAYSRTTGKQKVKGVPPGAAEALLQLLFLLVQLLEDWTHIQLRIARFRQS
ncbi:hypothetical protein WJX77_009621 [Trebouxia sp. C0004]